MDNYLKNGKAAQKNTDNYKKKSTNSGQISEKKGSPWYWALDSNECILNIDQVESSTSCNWQMKSMHYAAINQIIKLIACNLRDKYIGVDQTISLFIFLSNHLPLLNVDLSQDLNLNVGPGFGLGEAVGRLIY